ncbi:DnaJ family domain-containing protein [Zoogloea sp.]|uniref:DnaJ family domain-containing protein n=1 Tax=Zoogloea sp. TaxID=49181 RepID=UPI0035B0431A
MSIFDCLAEQRIREAVAKGQLSGLPGEGRPLVLDDDLLVPSEVRMSNRILRNAGYVPPAMADLRELRRLCEQGVQVDEPASVRRVLRMTALLARIEAAGLAHVSAALLRRMAANPDAK